jgi:hypothetical protein
MKLYNAIKKGGCMKIKSLILMSVVTVSSLGAVSARNIDFTGANLFALTPGVDTGVVGACGQGLDNALVQAISYLTEQALLSNSKITYIGKLLGESNSKKIKQNSTDMVTFVNTGQKKSNTNTLYVSFVNNLPSYKNNMFINCLRVNGVKVNGVFAPISPKELLTEVVKQLKLS